MNATPEGVNRSEPAGPAQTRGPPQGVMEAEGARTGMLATPRKYAERGSPPMKARGFKSTSPAQDHGSRDRNVADNVQLS
jgi:hypothetical protein